MRFNRKLLIGIVVVMIGTAVVDIPIIKHMNRKDVLPQMCLGFALMAIGAYYIFAGKNSNRKIHAIINIKKVGILLVQRGNFSGQESRTGFISSLHLN